MYQLAEFNIGILIGLLYLVITVISSSKKKKLKNKAKGGEQVSPPKSGLSDLFGELSKQFENVKTELAGAQDKVKSELGIKSEIEPEQPVIRVSPEFKEAVEKQYQQPTVSHRNLKEEPAEEPGFDFGYRERNTQPAAVTLVTGLGSMDELRKAIVLKEVLDKPLALRPFAARRR